MEAGSTRWFTVSSEGNQRLPEWARSAAFADDGTVFIPAAVTGSETAALLSAAYDGVTIVRNGTHAYLPADWIRTEYPEAADLVAKIEATVREFFT